MFFHFYQLVSRQLTVKERGYTDNLVGNSRRLAKCLRNLDRRALASPDIVDKGDTVRFDNIDHLGFEKAFDKRPRKIALLGCEF